MTASIETQPRASGARGAGAPVAATGEDLRPLVWFLSLLASFALLTLSVARDTVAGWLRPRRA